MTCLFVSDLHGSVERYHKLRDEVLRERPAAVFIGGDLLPHPGLALRDGRGLLLGFVDGFLAPLFADVREALGPEFPEIFLILGNDDPRTAEEAVVRGEKAGLWRYAHGRRLALAPGHVVYGYAYVPPTPFRLKDWERYDVSRYVDPGCVSPEEGWRSVAVPESEARYATIRQDLERLAGDHDLGHAVFLFHAPPYGSLLDRAALDGRKVDHVPVDVHVGSIAMRRFIESRRPLATLHGHVHESARLTGAWKERIGRTVAISAAHDGEELALVRFDLDAPAAATRALI